MRECHFCKGNVYPDQDYLPTPVCTTCRTAIEAIAERVVQDMMKQGR